MIAVRMKGDLDEIILPAPFQVFVANLNTATANGMAYLIMEDTNDKAVALNMNNILTVRERDDELDMIG